MSIRGEFLSGSVFALWNTWESKHTRVTFKGICIRKVFRDGGSPERGGMKYESQSRKKKGGNFEGNTFVVFRSSKQRYGIIYESRAIATLERNFGTRSFFCFSKIFDMKVSLLEFCSSMNLSLGLIHLNDRISWRCWYHHKSTYSCYSMKFVLCRKQLFQIVERTFLALRSFLSNLIFIIPFVVSKVILPKREKNKWQKF